MSEAKELIIPDAVFVASENAVLAIVIRVERKKLFLNLNTGQLLNVVPGSNERNDVISDYLSDIFRCRIAFQKRKKHDIFCYKSFAISVFCYKSLNIFNSKLFPFTG